MEMWYGIQRFERVRLRVLVGVAAGHTLQTCMSFCACSAELDVCFSAPIECNSADLPAKYRVWLVQTLQDS